MEHGALHLCDVFTRWVLRWWWLWHVYTDMDGGGPRAELLARVADMFSRCWKLEATSQTLECSMHGWWDGNLAHISRISPHSTASAKLQQSVSFSSPFFSRLANSFCVSSWVVSVFVWGGVATCPLLTQISPAQGRGWGWPPSRTRAPKSRTSTRSKTVKVLCKDNACKLPILILDPDI